jgi:hypothetical protein
MAQTRPVPSHRQLARLQIPPPLGDQVQPITLDGKPLFSPGPASPFHPSLTPQMLTGPGFQSGPYFPNRQAPPHLTMHRSRPSIVPANVPLPSTPNIAQLAFNPGLSIFPGTQQPPGPSVGRSGIHPYPPRRQPSISIGGPPKAVLGGPRKVDATSASDVAPGALSSLAGGVVEVAKPKSKKCIVKLPIEWPSTAGSSTGEILRTPWARNPLRIPVSDELDCAPPPDIITMEIYPELGSSGAHALPSTIEVFLPGKVIAICALDIAGCLSNLPFFPSRVRGKNTRIKLSRRNLQN